MNLNKKVFIIILITAITFALILVCIYLTKNNKKGVQVVSSFEECVAAGYPVLESYPEQCRTPDGKSFTRKIPAADISDEVTGEINSKNDLIRVDEPVRMSVISSPLTFRGQARGSWFFEAVFPVVLVNWDGVIIAETEAKAVLDPSDPNSTWMTEDFVAFEGTIEFTEPSWEDDFSKRGALIFQKSNPSDLPENDDALEIPILFTPLQNE